MCKYTKWELHSRCLHSLSIKQPLLQLTSLSLQEWLWHIRPCPERWGSFSCWEHLCYTSTQSLAPGQTHPTMALSSLGEGSPESCHMCALVGTKLVCYPVASAEVSPELPGLPVSQFCLHRPFNRDSLPLSMWQCIHLLLSAKLQHC